MIESESTQKTNPMPQNAQDTPILTRSEVLKMLGECITSIHKKLKTGRNRNAEKDKMRENLLRAQGYLSNVYLSGLKDLELEQLNDRILKLETARGRP